MFDAIIKIVAHTTLAVSLYFIFSVEECSNFLFFIVIDMNDNFIFTIACPCRPTTLRVFPPPPPHPPFPTRRSSDLKKKKKEICSPCHCAHFVNTVIGSIGLTLCSLKTNTSLVSGIVNKLFSVSKETVHLTSMHTTFLHCLGLAFLESPGFPYEWMLCL